MVISYKEKGRKEKLYFHYSCMSIEYIPFDEDGCPGTYALADTSIRFSMTVTNKQI
jgi:hypothetical protein